MLGTIKYWLKEDNVEWERQYWTENNFLLCACARMSCALYPKTEKNFVHNFMVEMRVSWGHQWWRERGKKFMCHGWKEVKKMIGMKQTSITVIFTGFCVLSFNEEMWGCYEIWMTLEDVLRVELEAWKWVNKAYASLSKVFKCFQKHQFYALHFFLNISGSFTPLFFVK